MSDPIRPPAPAPCGSCPYRRDVPSGVWSEEEYDKLPPYDGKTWEPSVFLCHQQDGCLCAGWVGCHDMEENLGLRIAVASGALDEKGYEAALDYETRVALFESGAEAAAHGKREIEEPGPSATKTVQKLHRRRSRRGSADDTIRSDESGEKEDA